jgi:hypothetical protein
LIPPFWFLQRQGKTEPAGTDTIRLIAPNLKEAFIGIRKGDNGLWSAFLRSTADGLDSATTAAEFAQAEDAWNAAFELYRVSVVV